MAPTYGIIIWFKDLDKRLFQISILKTSLLLGLLHDILDLNKTEKNTILSLEHLESILGENLVKFLISVEKTQIFVFLPTQLLCKSSSGDLSLSLPPLASLGSLYLSQSLYCCP